jgi:hypothetical protein
MAEMFARLRGPSMIGFAIYLGFEIVETSIAPGHSLLRDILGATRDVLLLPFCIAIYRLLILGEVASQYSLAISLPCFQRLLGWTIGLWCVIAILFALCLASAARRKVIFHNPNDTTKIAVCPVGPTRAVGGSQSLIVAVINGAGCTTILPYGQVEISGSTASGPQQQMGSAWVGIASAPGSAFTVYEWE